MSLTEQFLYINQLIGTVAFALSGALTAIDRRLDLFGVVFLGSVTALGGGVIRDTLLGQFPAAMFKDYTFLLLAVLTGLVVFIVAYLNRRHYLDHREAIDRFNNFFDAVGLATFTVVGIQIAVDAGYQSNPIFCIFLGVTTGIGGGILRDMMSCAIPSVLRKHIYALASIAGGTLYFVCVFVLHARISVTALLVILLIVAIRLLAARYLWSLPRIRFSMPSRDNADKKDGK